MEICDVFNEAGQSIGRTVTRGTRLEPGEYYLVAQVWIRDENGNYLIQQRAPHLKIGAGMWAITAGQVLAGEPSLNGAIREVREELGLVLLPDAFTHFERLFNDDLMQDIWFADVRRSSLGEITINEDVSAVQWAPKSTIAHMVDTGTFYPYSYLQRLPE